MSGSPPVQAAPTAKDASLLWPRDAEEVETCDLSRATCVLRILSPSVPSLLAEFHFRRSYGANRPPWRSNSCYQFVRELRIR